MISSPADAGEAVNDNNRMIKTEDDRSRLIVSLAMASKQLLALVVLQIKKAEQNMAISNSKSPSSAFCFLVVYSLFLLFF